MEVEDSDFLSINSCLYHAANRASVDCCFFLVRAVEKRWIFVHKKWKKSGKKVEFFSTKVEFLVELCGIFRSQRRTCLTFAASTTNNVSRGDASV